MQKTNKKLFLGLVLVFLVLGFSRLYNLEILPIFADEAIYIHWAQMAWHNPANRFIAITDGKPPLHTWFMIPFLKVFSDPLLAGRLLSIGGGLLSVVGVFAITKIWTKKTSVWYILALLTVASPFMLFYDRLAVADSWLTAGGVWSFYFAIKMKEDKTWYGAILLGLILGASQLIKPSSLFFMVLSFFSIVFLSYREKGFTRRYLPKMLLVLLESTLVYSVIKLSPYPHLISVRTYDYILGKREFLADPFRLFWGNLKAIAAWIYSYQGLFPGMFMVIAAVYGLKKKFKFVLLVLAWILSPIVISAFIGRIIFPRYFLVVQPFLILLLLPLVERVLTKWRKFGVAVLLLVFSYWVYFDFMLLNIPAKAPLTKQEQSQYMASWAAGYGIKEAAQYIVKESGGKNKVYVATEGYFGTLPDGLMIYLTDYPNIEVYGIGQPIYNLPEELKERAKETDAYLVVNDSRLKTDLPGVTAKYPKPVFSFQPQESLLLIKL